MLVSRIWDAITDPLMGHISDKTKSRFGKRRLYLVFASPLILVSFYMLFFPYQFEFERSYLPTKFIFFGEYLYELGGHKHA